MYSPCANILALRVLSVKLSLLDWLSANVYNLPRVCKTFIEIHTYMDNEWMVPKYYTVQNKEMIYDSHTAFLFWCKPFTTSLVSFIT